MTKHVIIVGAGFAGLNAAKKLGRMKDVRVTLIDKRNHHLFQPLLYQVSTAALSPADIAVPIRAVLAGYKNTSVLLGHVDKVDLAAKNLVMDGQVFTYDYLILACGAKHSYFGKNEWESDAPGLKTLEQATEIRRRILLAFEMAEQEKDAEKQKKAQTFIIVGGGPTGVEMAGSIAELSRHTFAQDFKNFNPARTRVILIETGPRILASFAPTLSEKATEDLEKLGVHVWTNSRVTNITAEGVFIGNEFVAASTVVWAAGVAPTGVNQTLGVALDRGGRVMVESDCSLKDFPEVFVLGDQAHFPGPDGKPLPGLAPVASQQGKYVAKAIKSRLKGAPIEAFRYLDKGAMATIGRNKAIAEMGPIKLHGIIAWLAWLVVHIYYLIGFKNRLLVFMQWAWSYVTYKKGARLILNKEWRTHTTPKDLS
ncbi:MAG TPA: NAD(P)/FAD-dependent oxidoreductase [Oligoflexus sp.]|uniref:NAD(P)/FAD-dependent oxidoreductase n=1 Tax=Oligoflexus sp. TaxID=1971216 RepID=UPI002D32C8F2|nr:NAD(P)/FAD-dependent oxidoreductase [Oligoflexus sp.]HYX35687.1 NAD(P)/FAD-dependent oxidoreductase [Oligoflexus sp.]